MTARKHNHRIFAGLLFLLVFYVIPAFSQDVFINSDPTAYKKSCKGFYSLTTDEIGKEVSVGSAWILKDRNDRSIVLDLSETSWNPHFSSLDLYGCVDIDNDGQLEAVVEYRSGGAHCCYTYLVYRKAKTKLKLIGRFYLGESSEPVFKDMDNDGVMEVIALDSRLAYFGGLCFACSPSLPLIMSYRNKEFVDCTAKFPEIIEKEIQKTLNERDSGIDVRGNALKLLALHIILGKETDGWRGIRKYYPETSSWLKEHSKELKKRLDTKAFRKRNRDGQRLFELRKK